MSIKVYIGIEKANKEIQDLLNVGLIPIIYMGVFNGFTAYSIGYYKELNLIGGDIMGLGK